MPRYFTRDEAQAFLPKVDRLMSQALDLRAVMDSTEKQLRDATRRISMLGGVVVKHHELIDLRARHDAALSTLRTAVEDIHDIGCLVKDLDLGLVDFPTLYRGQEVQLCWKRGETGIDFWHSLEEGFRGRKPIDEDFLAHHSGSEG